MITNYEPLSGIVKAGFLDRKIQFYEQTTTKVNGSPKKVYGHAGNRRAHIAGLNESESIVAAAETNTAIVEIWIRYYSVLVTATENYEAFRINISTVDPVYLYDLSLPAKVLRDLNGNPLIDEELTTKQYYEILGIDEFGGRKRFMKILARRWR